MSDTHEEAPKGGGLVFWLGVSAGITAMLLAGWYFGKTKNIQPPKPQMAKVDCAPVPAGMQWKGGQLTPLPAANASSPAACAPAPVETAGNTDWLAPVAAGFAPAGFDWMGANQGGETIYITGMADDEAAKATAFDHAVAAIRSADDGAHKDANIVNQIQLKPWADDMDAKLKGMGFDWLNLSVRGPVATVSGSAPDTAAKNAAFAAAEAEISGHATASGQITRVINGISVEGGDAGAAEALVELSNAEGDTLTVKACSAAFDKTMQGRNIQFRTGSAAISEESAQLLEALSGIAILCVNTNNHRVEVAGHTDARGDAGANQRLSQSRANAVRAYLINLGVDGGRLESIGYGESQLLDEATTEAAHARNRRTEFRVK